MIQRFIHWKQYLSKPLLFGLYGAIGCFLAAAAGEIFLELALPTQITQRPVSLPQVDIMFVLDVTGSMDKEIQGVQHGIQEFAKEISSRKLDAQVGLIAFGDRFFGEEPQILSFKGSPLTHDTTDFSRQVGNVNRRNGQDLPESSLDALVLAASQPFRSNATKVILLITDAPPRIPDQEVKSLSDAAQDLRDHDINQLHLIIQEGDRSIYTPLQTSVPGEIFSLSATASGRDGFARILPLLGATIAETTIKGLASTQEFAPESQQLLLLIFSGWTAILAIGIALALIMGQNAYLRRRLLTIPEGIKGTIGSAVAGGVAGVAGQLLFIPVSGIPLFLTVGRIFGWTLLAMLLGGGMSLFVPNLRLNRALLGGAIGGMIGSATFVGVSYLLGDLAGRLVGSIIIGFFIGLMLALLEQISHQAWLIVHWTPTEQSRILIGSKPILLGTSSNAHIPLSKAHGYFPSTAQIFQEGDTIIMQYDPEYGQKKGMQKLRHELKEGEKRQFKPLTLEIQTSTQSH